MYHLLLVDEFGAAEAHRIGLVQEVVKPGQQVARALELAETIANNAPLGIQVTKLTARKFYEAGEAAAIAAMPSIRAAVMGTEDMQEGMRSFIERRPAVFKGR
jgi:enoyl-CoA hydratase/carnithine racemase